LGKVLTVDPADAAPADVPARLGPDRRRLALAGSFTWFAFATAAMVAPIYPAVGNRIEPRIFGLPFSMTWVLLFIVANTIVLALLYRSGVVDASEG
jgi:hypothetical protein